ncbi:MAG TPA: hypothetical protein VJN18_00790 [Polyangiaceae bacterium]|nr:hypothetical protein [Polyangiaceae bacterium]
MRASKPTPPAECLYLGCFFYDDVLNDKDCTGTFQMVVSASTPEQSLDRFRTRLRAIHRLGNVLTSPSTVYLQGVVPLTGSFKEALLVNCEFRPRPDAPDYQVVNMLPPQGIKTPGSFELVQGKDESIQPFVDFGGLAHQRAEQRAKESSRPAGWPAQPPKPRLSPEERKKQKEEAAANRAKKQLERETAKKVRQAAADEKKKRAAALKVTLAELGR